MIIADEVFSHGSASDPTAQNEIGTVAVLEWNVLPWKAWNGFLLKNVLGQSGLRIEIDPFLEFPSAQIEQICESFTTVCFHIDLSVRRGLTLRIRELTERFVEQGVYVVNGLVQDIRKSKLHAHLEAIGLPSLKASPAGSPDEILFVKTELNYGGNLERQLSPEMIAAAGLKTLISPTIGSDRYKTVERSQLEKTIWTDPALVVERFVTNTENSFYRAYFSGEQVIIVKAFAAGTIKKLSDDPRDINYVSELGFLKAGTGHVAISEALQRDVATFIENTPVEFGCIDIVHDGHDHHYIIDLNLTPSCGTDGNAELDSFLRMGITDRQRRKQCRFRDSPLA